MKSAFNFTIILASIFLVLFLVIIFMGLNSSLFILINSSASMVYPALWEYITILGDTLTVTALILLFIRKKPELISSAIFASIIASLLSNILKFSTDVLRPPAVIDITQIKIIGPALTSHSFPSGHTITIFTFAGLLILNFNSLAKMVTVIVLALLVGFSRIAVGVHWPADVMAGAAIGLICAAAGTLINSKLMLHKILIFNLIVGFLLLCSTVFFLFFYDTGYKDSDSFKYLIGIGTLMFGTIEYYFVMKEFFLKLARDTKDRVKDNFPNS